ncbi:acyl-CoA dehydrogenase family protein [Candidatus Flexifilum breve]|uniref:acyl-CoA dehydrogenase family protein n=1 Tax=Candidatus Flexifilum breve TaxID=3140694 RepID=UPI0031CCD071
MLGEVGRGFRQTMATLDNGRIGIGALSVRLARPPSKRRVKYAQQRRAFGKPIGEHQAIQWMIADAALEIDAARLLVYRSRMAQRSGQRLHETGGDRKLMATEVAERVSRNAIQIHGSYGYSREFPVERIYRDQRLSDDRRRHERNSAHGDRAARAAGVFVDL